KNYKWKFNLKKSNLIILFILFQLIVFIILQMIINKKEISFCATKFEINGISYKDMDTRLRTQNLDLYFFKDIDIFKRLQHNKFLIS
mgnify:CR=1